MGLPPLTVPAQLTGRRSGTVLRAQTPPSPQSPSRERARAMRTKLTAHDGSHDGSTPESPTSVLQPHVAADVVEDLTPGDEGEDDAQTSAGAESSDVQVGAPSMDAQEGNRAGNSASPLHRRKVRWSLLGAAVVLAIGALRAQARA